ncbi:hypothetical protein SSPO_006060 [Streptomyces antimycoticus]|uniref:DJ-1/PfpI domain-containing protein n=1 Tax=Streptomyces antimycoticus TaxID=68175 RepID=A0A499UER8_9ACTN|nr:hypothetical protein SSPO_006060 [Streptomyces antimycoticus]
MLLKAALEEERSSWRRSAAARSSRPWQASSKIRHATTHQLGLDTLDATGVHAVRARVVDDGDLASAGGVTSGLDLGLYLLEREVGPQIAHTVEEFAPMAST